jgi:hypothetical protein
VRAQRQHLHPPKGPPPRRSYRLPVAVLDEEALSVGAGQCITSSPWLPVAVAMAARPSTGTEFAQSSYRSALEPDSSIHPCRTNSVSAYDMLCAAAGNRNGSFYRAIASRHLCLCERTLSSTAVLLRCTIPALSVRAEPLLSLRCRVLLLQVVVCDFLLPGLHVLLHNSHNSCAWPTLAVHPLSAARFKPPCG